MFNIGNLLRMDDFEKQCYGKTTFNYPISNSANYPQSPNDSENAKYKRENSPEETYCREIDDKTLQRRQINRLRTAKKRAAETPYEREIRLWKNKMRNKYRRELETLEQRAERNRRNTERNRIRRLKKKEYLEGQHVFNVDDRNKSHNGVENFLRIELSPSPQSREGSSGADEKHFYPQNLHYTQLR